MEKVVREPTLAELGAGVEANLAALFRAMATLPGGVVDESGPVSRHLTFPTNPMFKGAWATRIPEADIEAAIDDTIGWFKSRGAPFFFWWSGPGTEPGDLDKHLEARGFLSLEGQQRELAHGIKQTAAGAPIMAADLRKANESILGRVPRGFVVEEVTDARGLADFKRIFVETYEIPAWAGQAWVDATLAFGIGKAPWRIFLGRLDGEAVATNMLFNGGGVASVYAVATLPKVQGKGIGAAVTLKPLLLARAEGYRHAVLFSTEMAFRVYERIGFRDCGVRLNRYLWRAA